MAQAQGVTLDVGDPIEHVRRLGGKIGGARPSMLLDFQAGRRCEIDAINGSIPRLGKPLGIPTPVNETVVGIVRSRERALLAAVDALARLIGARGAARALRRSGASRSASRAQPTPATAGRSAR